MNEKNLDALLKKIKENFPNSPEFDEAIKAKDTGKIMLFLRDENAKAFSIEQIWEFKEQGREKEFWKILEKIILAGELRKKLYEYINKHI